MPASNPNQSGYQLWVGGQIWGGWTEIEVTKSLDVLCGAFTVTTTDLSPDQPAAWPIQTGLAAKVTIDGETLITGWIDEVEPTFDAEDHKITARGRGRTCDLVDCSAMNEPGRWADRALEQIVTDLCSPFRISVTAMADTGDTFDAFALQQAESVKDAIDRLCQQRGVLPFETPTGDLQLIAPGTAMAGGQVTVGVNVLSASAKHDAHARFSQYVVKGQRQGHDGDNGAAVSQATGQAADGQVTRYRPLMILAEEQATGGSAASRAQFAATVRAGRAQTGSLTVQGDRDAGGALWAPSTLVNVNAAVLGLQGNLLIREVKFRADDSGTVTVLDVVRPEAYSLGEVKGVGLSRLDSRNAGRGAKARRR